MKKQNQKLNKLDSDINNNGNIKQRTNTRTY